MVQVAQGFPKLNSALVDQKTGAVTQPWLQFFISLWNRTGGGAATGFITSITMNLLDGITGGVTPDSDAVITLGLGSITPTSVTASGNITGANLSGTNTGDVVLFGENYLSLVAQNLTANPVDLTGSNVTGELKAASFPILTGDVTTPGGSLVTTIPPNTITDAQMALGTANSLTGYDAGGNFSTVAVGNQLALSGGTLTTNGISTTIVTAKLTGGGTNGSMTFVNGVLTASTPAT